MRPFFVHGDIISFIYDGFKQPEMQYYHMIQRMLSAPSSGMQIVQISGADSDVDLAALQKDIPAHWSDDFLKNLSGDFDTYYKELFGAYNTTSIPAEHTVFYIRLPQQYGKNAFALLSGDDIDGAISAAVYCVEADTEILAYRLKELLGADNYKIRGGAPPQQVENGTVAPFSDLNIESK